MAKKKVAYNAFKREVGKNTGKVLSNFLFGDSHSTPHRMKIQREKTKQLKQKIIDNTNTIEGLENIEKEFQEKINQLSKERFPKGIIDLTSYLYELEILISSNKWKGIGADGNEKHKITNNYTDALLEKYSQGVYILSYSETNKAIISKFKRKEKKFIILKFIQIYGVKILIFIIIIIAFTVLSIKHN